MFKRGPAKFRWPSFKVTGYHSHGGTGWRSWFRHCAANLEVAGSIPDSVIGIFHWHNPSGHTTALGLTRPKSVQCVRPPTLLPSSRGSVLAFGTQFRGFRPGRSRRIFHGEKIHSTPSFGREVKPFVPCRIFAACKRTRKCMRGSRSFRSKLPVISHPGSSSFHY